MPAASATVSRVITKEEMCAMEKTPSACGIVIFGASGDLTHRKLLPSLLALSLEKLLPKSFYILGVARSEMTDAAFQVTVRDSITGLGSPKAQDDFAQHCSYIRGDYADPQTYEKLRQKMAELDAQYQTSCRHLFYLSTPPTLYAVVAEQLGKMGFADSRQTDGWVRVVFEKPFGTSLATAQELNRSLQKVFREKQIYRIDHYLGKETVQNILMFRFANAIYEPVWNNKYIDHVQITAAESDGVEHRAGYYEGAGATRDMFQNHLFQLMSLIAMEPPASMAPDAVRDEKSKVMASLAFPKDRDWEDQVVRGQYEAGAIHDKVVIGYRQEPGVKPDSSTETFTAIKVEIDNWRWHGVPFYLRSGKRMSARETDIIVVFKHVPTSVFQPLVADQISPNILHFRIQPNEGILLRFEAKHPGPKVCMSSVTMHFDYEEAFGVKPSEAYARLFHDVMIGDQTLFAREDWLEHSWKFLDPLLGNPTDLCFYPAGSWGPKEADDLLRRDGRAWLNT
jgi:glucose-6-phosphate 1-dehydrogenase